MDISVLKQRINMLPYPFHKSLITFPEQMACEKRKEKKVKQ